MQLNKNSRFIKKIGSIESYASTLPFLESTYHERSFLLYITVRAVRIKKIESYTSR